MSYKDKPQLHLYEYKNNSFLQIAIIDDFQEVSFEHNLYSAGIFTITINYNIPNALLFERGMFIQFGSDPYDFGEILSIRDVIGQDGKGSQIRTITGYDARYIFKRRIIKNLNANGMWKMTAKGELCLRNLIADQCGANAEEKRRLPIINTIPQESDALGKEYFVSEQFTNLYEVCKTIATQSEIGWRVKFENGSLKLECYEGTDRSDTVQFSTDFDSLRNGEFSDSSESYSNAIYIGGKGQNDERDIYEGEDGNPNGLDRFEAWDDQSQMTTTDEYTAEALSMLSQYGQTVNVSGNGLAKCPYVYKEQYDVGDIITIAFSGKTAKVQILSVTERWAWNQYDINFSFGKPQNNLAEQLQLMLRKIQGASNKEKATESVKWYTIPTVTSMPADDVTFNTIGFTGTMTANSTFTLYRDSEGTGAKSYNVYCKNLSGNYTLTLTTGVSGATNFTIKGGSNIVARILVDENGNIVSQSMTATDAIESGNNQPATSGGVADELNNPIVKTFENGTGSDVIIHLGSFTTSNRRRIGLIADVETRRVDSSAQEFVSIGIGNIWVLKSSPNFPYISEIYLYRTDDLHYDVYLKAVSYAKTYIKITSPVNFTLDWFIVTSYQGTKVEPVSFISSDDIDNIIYDTSITDCNNAFKKGKTKTYWFNSDVANIPTTNNGWYIISQCNPNQVSENNYITQIATVGSNFFKNEMYIRHAYLSGSSIVFSSWKKLINSADSIYVVSTTNTVVFDISSFYGSGLSLHFKFSATGNANRIHIAEGVVSVWNNVGKIEILYKGSYISNITIDTQAKTITVDLTERTYGAWLSYEPITDFALVP